MLISGRQIGIGFWPGISDDSPILYRQWPLARGASVA
jgi:hypothetical protein